MSQWLNASQVYASTQNVAHPDTPMINISLTVFSSFDSSVFMTRIVQGEARA